MWEKITPLAAFLLLLLIFSLIWAFVPPQYLEQIDPICIDDLQNPKTADEPDLCINQEFRSKGEKICCETMSNLFKKPFTTVRPDWLKNPETGRNLELDCYNEELKIAVEYNGIQHYKFPNPFNKTEEDFIKQVRRDLMKEELCKTNAVRLITVPYTISHSEIPKFLRAQVGV